MQNAVKFSEEGRDIVAKLSGEIDHHAAKGQREAIDAMLFKVRPQTLVLDFSDVKFMDSSGIGLIIGRTELCTEMGASLRISGLSPTLKKLVRLSGVEKIKCLTIVSK